MLKLKYLKFIIPSLTHFMPIFPFYTPGKRQKTRDFLIFSGGIEMEHWPEIG